MQLIFIRLIKHLPLAFSLAICAGLINSFVARANTVPSVNADVVASAPVLPSNQFSPRFQSISSESATDLHVMGASTMDYDTARFETFVDLELASQPEQLTEMAIAEPINPQKSQQPDLRPDDRLDVSQTIPPIADVSEEASIRADQDVEPIPHDISTSASVLLANEHVSDSTVESASDAAELDDIEMAQAIDPGRTTRTGSSYVGIGTNIGFGDDENALSEFSFATFAKIGFTPEISLRPAVFIRDDVSVLVPITLDLSPQGIGRFALGPYFGGGVAITTGDDSDVGPLLSAGVDVPFGDRFTGTGGINLAFLDDVNVGILLGVGYNF
jgi:hypothetical protein